MDVFVFPTGPLGISFGLELSSVVIRLVWGGCSVSILVSSPLMLVHIVVRSFRFQRVCVGRVWQRMFALQARILLSRWCAVHDVSRHDLFLERAFRVIVCFSLLFAFVCRRRVAVAVSARVCLQRVVPGAARPVSRRVRQSACTITLVWVVCVCVWFLI